ncbi:MAG: hypothetical protein JWM61_1972 [Micrococcaceae bacterium]|nr:hypothetical protein [Micrococcaceae bacterium]
MSGAVDVLTQDGRTAGVLLDGGGEPSAHSPRPFLHPVLTPGGRTVSDYRPADHLWHWGLGIAVATIDVVGQEHPVNLWGGPTYVRGEGYVQLANNGSQRLRHDATSEDAMRQQLAWCAADGTAFLSEERTWSVGAVPVGGVEWFRTTVRSRWRNISGGELVFGSPTTAGRPDAGYGGFFLRLAPTFDGADVVAADPDVDRLRAPGTGDRVHEAQAMGSTGPWLGMKSVDTSVLMVQEPGNPGGYSPWFVRSTGTPMLCAAPFFRTVMRLEPAGILDWSWSLLVADGAVGEEAFAEAARVAVLPRRGSADTTAA